LVNLVHLVVVASSSKLDSADKKTKNLSSRKALAKFANSELKPEKKNKSNSTKKKNPKPSDIKNQPKPVMVASSDVHSKFANTDAVSWRKMKDDALVEKPAIQSRSTQLKPSTKLLSQTSSFAVLADFSENALVFKALTGGDTYAVQWPLTVIKYAMLALSAVLLSSIMVVSGMLGTMAMLFLRFFFPISIAVLVAGIGGRMGGDIVGATFPLGLMLLAIYAKTLNSL